MAPSEVRRARASFVGQPGWAYGTLELVNRWFVEQKRETPTLEQVESGRLLDGGVYWKQLELFASLRSRRSAFK